VPIYPMYPCYSCNSCFIPRKIYCQKFVAYLHILSNYDDKRILIKELRKLISEKGGR
jgi:hypothetical protein